MTDNHKDTKNISDNLLKFNILYMKNKIQNRFEVVLPSPFPAVQKYLLKYFFKGYFKVPFKEEQKYTVIHFLKEAPNKLQAMVTDLDSMKTSI